MTKGRLEAFSDGVMAIIITIMVLELEPPDGATREALAPLFPIFVTYVVSFLFIGIYWNNHHHLLHASDRVNGGILWANIHLLFWLSLVPFVTGWVGHNYAAPLPTAIYGAVLLASGIAYTILARAIVSLHGTHSRLAQALGRDRKGKISLACYASAIPLAFLAPWISDVLYVVVALIWLVPDRRIESRLAGPAQSA
jgi:uncharacterized membrane protein